jgi:anti-sigma B factor antagonist
MQSRFETEHGDAGICIIRARGDVDLATAPELDKAIHAAASTKPRSVMLDLSEVTFLDSSGIRVLVEAQRQLEELGAKFTLDGMSPALTRVFEIAGVIDLLRHTPQQ